MEPLSYVAVYWVYGAKAPKRKQVMAGAIALGALAGVVGFIPLVIGLHLTKYATATSNFGHMSILIIALIVSFALMFAFAFVCITFARDFAMPFVLAEAVALSVVAIAFGIARLVRK